VKIPWIFTFFVSTNSGVVIFPATQVCLGDFMKEKLIDRLKRTVIEGATKTADYVEDAARLGKLHLDLMNERRRLQNAQASLGVWIYDRLEDQEWESLKEDTAFVRLVGEITEVKANIQELQTKIELQKQQGKLQA
jgi:hypothetical protein